MVNLRVGMRGLPVGGRRRNAHPAMLLGRMTNAIPGLRRPRCGSAVDRVRIGLDRSSPVGYGPAAEEVPAEPKCRGVVEWAGKAQ